MIIDHRWSSNQERIWLACGCCIGKCKTAISLTESERDSRRFDRRESVIRRLLGVGWRELERERARTEAEFGGIDSV